MTGMSDPIERRARRRRAVRWTIPFVLILLMLVGSYVAWEVRTRHALARAIDEWKAAGEPVEAGDFEAAPIADESNAAVVLLRAGEELNIANDPMDADGFTGDLPLSDAQ